MLTGQELNEIEFFMYVVLTPLVRTCWANFSQFRTALGVCVCVGHQEIVNQIGAFSMSNPSGFNHSGTDDAYELLQ